MNEINKKLKLLNAEYEKIQKNYNDAKNVMIACERKLLQLEGGIAICEDLQKTIKATKTI